MLLTRASRNLLTTHRGLELIIIAPAKPSRVHQYRPIHQTSPSDRHPASGGLNQSGMSEQDRER